MLVYMDPSLNPKPQTLNLNYILLPLNPKFPTKSLNPFWSQGESNYNGNLPDLNP